VKKSALAAFFSYSRDDSEFALRLAEDLKTAGANVWLDQMDIPAGQRWDRAVEDALKSCPRLIVILSPASVDSTNVMDEVSFALEEKKTVIPIICKDCEVPFRLRRVQYVDFRKDYARGLKELLKTLNPEQSTPAISDAPRQYQTDTIGAAIVLSYRRDDAEGEAGHLFDDLIVEFGTDKVFMDVTGMEAGRDFHKVIDQNVSSCRVLLAMIGRNWIDSKDQAGRRRLDDPLDYVRLETAAALKRDIPVIPVLVRGAPMPRPNQLPEDLKDLAYRSAVELTHDRWDFGVQVLIKALRSYGVREPKVPDNRH